MPRRAAPQLARLLQPQGRQRQLGEAEMKILLTLLLLVVASSQFACAPLLAGAAVGGAIENERDERDDDRD